MSEASLSAAAGGLILPFGGKTPRIADSAFIAANATLIGEVEIGDEANIWFNCVLRADGMPIHIGARTNIQDGTIIHVDTRSLAADIGADVTVGHLALIHACTIEDGAFIGMRAVVMDGAVVESGAMVAAGALVAPGKRVKKGELWAGIPARALRPLSQEEIDHFPETVKTYVDLGRQYRGGG